MSGQRRWAGARDSAPSECASLLALSRAEAIRAFVKAVASYRTPKPFQAPQSQNSGASPGKVLTLLGENLTPFGEKRIYARD